MTLMSFWKTTQQFAEPTRKLASFVFQLKGHVAHGDFVLIIIIFKTQNQEQDDDRQPQNHWINSQVTERQHPHSEQER